MEHNLSIDRLGNVLVDQELLCGNISCYGKISGTKSIPQSGKRPKIRHVQLEKFPTKSVTKSHLDQRKFFIDKLGTIGGTLGVCARMSVLSMVEVFVFIMTITTVISFSSIPQVSGLSRVSIDRLIPDRQAVWPPSQSGTLVFLSPCSSCT